MDDKKKTPAENTETTQELNKEELDKVSGTGERIDSAHEHYYTYDPQKTKGKKCITDSPRRENHRFDNI